MDYYQTLYQSMKNFEEEDSSLPKGKPLGLRYRLKSDLVRRLQADLVWHGFAFALKIYFPYELCCKLSSFPSVKVLCVEYLKFCNADLGVATRVQLQSRFEQFATWKESGLDTPPPIEFSQASVKSWFRSGGSHQIFDREVPEDAAETARRLGGFAREFRGALDEELLAIQRTAMVTITRSNLGRTMAKMARQITEIYRRLGLTGEELSISFMKSLMRIVRAK